MHEEKLYLLEKLIENNGNNILIYNDNKLSNNCLGKKINKTRNQ